MTSVPPQRSDHDETAWVAAWAQALTALELDVDHTEAVLTAIHRGAELPSAASLLDARWEPPAGLGPLPHPLLERARRLLQRQEQTTEALSRAVATNRRLSATVVAVRPGGPSRPVYFDRAL